MDNIKNKFGKRIRELRKRKKLTQEKLAELIGIEPRNVLKIENGQTFPRTSTLMKLAEIFDCPVATLFEFEHLIDIKTIQTKLIDKINSDENFAIMIYKLII